MNAKRLYMILIRMVMLSVLITSISGCDRQAKHKVLTFFFTGVPPLEEQAQKKEGAEKDKTKEVEKKAAPQPTLYTHPLTAARQCSQCHQTTANFGLFGQKGRPYIFRKGLSPGPLVVPRKELCTTCHKDKSAAETITEGLWLHNTPAKGECHKCHDPHQSNHRYQLLDTPRQICIPCHKDPKVMDLAAHKEPGECLTCHNPHLGKDKKMLKKDYQEVEHRLRLSPELPGAKEPPGSLPKRGTSSQE
jgi:predicted CXXCH cytochrome family protein